MAWLRKNKGLAFDAVAASIALLFAVMSLVAFLGNAEARIGEAGNVTDNNNPHNLSAGSGGAEAQVEDEICIFCHTPHTSFRNAALLDPPLWNHEMSSTSSYTVKSSSSNYSNATIGNITLLSSPPSLPDGVSRLCLSCHDGAISVGAIYSRSDISMETTCYSGSGETFTETAGLSSGALTSACRAYIGTNLTNKHVVSVPMNSQLISDAFANCPSASVDTRLKYPWVTSGSYAGQPNRVVLRPTATTYKSLSGITKSSIPGSETKYEDGYNYGVQCSTCHDPHLWDDGSGDGGTTWGDSEGEAFLVAPFNDLCKACHYPCP